MNRKSCKGILSSENIHASSHYEYRQTYMTCRRALTQFRPRQYCSHFANDIFKCIFMNENVWILIRISLKVFPKVRINNIPALVQIMAWRRPGDKPLSEQMMVCLLTHICANRPQWVKTFDCSTGRSRYNTMPYFFASLLNTYLLFRTAN